MSDVQFADLKGHTVVSISGAEKDSYSVVIETDGGSFELYHEQDCCEAVLVAEVHGSPEDLVGGVVVIAEESCHGRWDPPRGGADSWTWTFHRLVTNRGTLVLRWLGQGNGYYSERVNLRQLLN